MNHTIPAADTSHDYRRCLAIMNRAEAEGRDLNPDECREMDSMMASISTSLAAETRSAGRLSEPNDVAIRAPGETRYSDNLPVRAVQGAKSYVNLFGRGDIGDAGGFKSFESFASVVARNQYHPRLEPMNAPGWHEEGIGQDGGFVVPPAFRPGLLDSMLEASVIMPRATLIGMESNLVNAPGWVSNNSATPGGFQGAWIAEGALDTPQTGVMRTVALRAKKFQILSDATAELLQDAQPSFAGQLQQQIGAALAHGLDTAFFCVPMVSRCWIAS